MLFVYSTSSHDHLACSSSFDNVTFANLQEVSSVILEKLVSAGIGDRPVVFVTHRYEISYGTCQFPNANFFALSGLFVCH